MKNTYNTQDKRLALFDYYKSNRLGTNREFIEDFENLSDDYLVLTDDEADDYVLEYIKESVWAFSPDFLAEHTNLPVEVFEALQDKCEDSNEAILRLIENQTTIKGFANDATRLDGRGHFLSSYDGDEHEVTIKGTYYFVYRMN